MIRELGVQCIPVLSLLRLRRLDNIRVLLFDYEAVKHDSISYRGPLAHPLPNMQELIIRLNDQDPSTNHSMISIAREIAAVAVNLRRIELSGKLDQSTIDQIALIPKLEALDLSKTTQADGGTMEHYRNFQSMPNLCQLVCPLISDEWAWAPAVTQIRPPRLTELISGGDVDVVEDDYNDDHENVLITFQNPSITHLRVGRFCLVHPSNLPKAITGYSGLQNLHLTVQLFSSDDIDFMDILIGLGPFPHLTDFYIAIDYARIPSERMAELEATHASQICRIGPQLRSVEVLAASFAFFQEILNLSQLAELRLNAVFWDNDWPVPAGQHLAMRSLHFHGRPWGWQAAATAEYLATVFPNLQTINVQSLYKENVVDEQKRNWKEDWEDDPCNDGQPFPAIPFAENCDIMEQVKKEVMVRKLSASGGV